MNILKETASAAICVERVRRGPGDCNFLQRRRGIQLLKVLCKCMRASPHLVQRTSLPRRTEIEMLRASFQCVCVLPREQSRESEWVRTAEFRAAAAVRSQTCERAPRARRWRRRTPSAGRSRGGSAGGARWLPRCSGRAQVCT
jgi:hypothetical protein